MLENNAPYEAADTITELLEALEAVAPVLDAIAQEESDDFGAHVQEGGSPDGICQLRMKVAVDRAYKVRAALAKAGAA